MTATDSDLIGQKLSNFYVEKHEYPTGSKVLSDIPIRVWVIASEEARAWEISVGPAGCTIRIETGKPDPVNMDEFGCSVILPQFNDKRLRATSVIGTYREPCEEGEKLTLQLSDGSELVFACHGDGELRPSIDQSKYR